ncbi:Defensin-like protein [Cardamine amara subsp. amara]|uniref:Defensin-like protein n=1 Tax=Cardamine amara subsp. amara TaxID=228776 RepID=A0ABD1A9A9_CARAN
MAISMKYLVAFVFTAIFIVSSVHCRNKATNGPGYGLKSNQEVLFNHGLCLKGYENCDQFCKRLVYDYGYCTTANCVCVVIL